MCEEERGKVEVSSTANFGKQPGVRFHRVLPCEPDDLRSRRGLPVTSPIRTLVDLAGVLNERALERAVDERSRTGSSASGISSTRSRPTGDAQEFAACGQ